MASIHEIKTRETTETPLLLFDCELTDGTLEHWSTHAVTVQGTAYSARVLSHDAFELRAGAEDGIDTVSRTTVLLANADSKFSQLARTPGFKGAKLTVTFVFFDLKRQESASEASVVFRGTCNPPDEITEAYVRLSFTSRMNLSRVLMPQVRVQRRCPWVFPSTDAQQLEAVDGGENERYSRLFRCGYSPSQSGGCGNPGFTSCDYTRAQCIERGMFDKDSAGRDTRRFGGIEFVPSTINVRTYGEKSTHSTGAVENEAKYNEFVPVVYGTAWYRPPIVFARNDGNLTHMEVLLGMGEIEGVLKVVVNGNELPEGKSATHATATGWYNIASYGKRTGEFNLDFLSNGKPQGDPYGSMAVLSVVVPNRLSDGSPLPKIEALVRGLRLPVFDDAGAYIDDGFTNNPAWVLLDLLRRSGWRLDEIDIASFAKTASYCAEQIDTTDLNGNPQRVARFQCNLVLRKRRSASDVIRGVRNASGLYLTYGAGGLLQLHPESSIAIQQPEKPASSNATTELNGGWPAYEFGDGLNGFSDIARKSDGRSSLRVWSRSTAESPNRYSVEFQDEFNEYQQDSLSLVDIEDTGATGHEVSGALPAMGIPNFNQAARIVRLALDRSIRGNLYLEFETGLRSLGLKPGDLITVSYRKEGLDRQLFRIIRLKPGLNFRMTAITAQIHNDEWYAGGDGSLGLIGGGRQPANEPGIPRPLLGTIAGSDGQTDFAVVERYKERTDGGFDVELGVEFATPTQPDKNAPPMPLVSLIPDVETTGGTITGKQDVYYAISAVNEDGAEGPLSFIVRASIPASTDTNTVTVRELSFGPGSASFHVYRGSSPAQLMRIAAHQPLAKTFTDTGAETSLAAPPDRNYHHANFYWRLELLPEHKASVRTETTIGNETLEMIENEYRGKVVRITKGRGRGQERIVTSNDSTTLTMSGAWLVEPDADSTFVVAESSWSFAAQVESSPAHFLIPNRHHAVVHICGRSANAHDRECAIELSPVTRHTIGGGAADADVPDAPVYGLSSNGQGRIDLGAIGFTDTHNTRSVIAGTLTLHFADEIAGNGGLALGSNAAVDDTSLTLNGPVEAQKGSLLQIGREVVNVRSCDGSSIEVDRAAYGTDAAAYEAGTSVYPLTRRAYVLPFVPGFFGTPASGSYSHSVSLPNARVVVSELYVTNSRGNSQVSSRAHTNVAGGGIRTLSGGQFTFQVDGPLAIQSAAVPPITIDANRAVRDVFATVTEAPVGGRILARLTINDEQYCDVVVAPGSMRSDTISGTSLLPLFADSRLGLDLIETGTEAPGAGLTVTVRV